MNIDLITDLNNEYFQKLKAAEAKVTEQTDSMQTLKDVYRKCEELHQGSEEDVRKLRQELDSARKEVTDIQRGERVVRVDLETTSKRVSDS